MRAVVQRVSRAKVTVAGEVVGEIGKGLLVLLGVSTSDETADAEYLAAKIANLRIFEPAEGGGNMTLSLVDIGGEMLVVSQFTLYGDVRRGRRPSYIEAAPPEMADELYRQFISASSSLVKRVETGRFRAMMDVESVNDGPVTILVDSSKHF